ncbi:hypothetical protein ACO0LF_18950 [Undibacterium sp. Di27W]|uniref:hypothetical protein n=1 Tax=Undibacterium sp. Di27W TaxID=3413036 RepID=UPI003BF32E76
MIESTYKSSATKSEKENAEAQMAPKADKILALFLTFIAMVLSGGRQYWESHGGIPEAIGGGIGGLLMSLIPVGLCQIRSKFRNEKSRYKIFLWSVSIVCTLSVVGFLQLFMLTNKA